MCLVEKLKEFYVAPHLNGCIRRLFENKTERENSRKIDILIHSFGGEISRIGNSGIQ